MKRILSLLTLLATTHPLYAQDLPVTRRLSVLTQAFLDRTTVQVEPAPVPGDKSRVLVLFRLSEAGAVIQWRASGGSQEARDSAVAALKEWRFKPTLLAGAPAHILSGVVFDFSATPVSSEAPSPMSAREISPVLSARCSLAIVNDDPAKVRICKKESAAVDKHRSHTDLESLTAHYEFGVALLLEGSSQKALAELDRAIDLAPSVLKPSDGEWAQMHWHRAVAKQRLGRTEDARLDFQISEKSYAEAAELTGIAKYSELSTRVAEQHEALEAPQ